MNATRVQCLSGTSQRWSRRTGPSRQRHVLQGTWFAQAQGRQIKYGWCPLALYHTAYMLTHVLWMTSIVWVLVFVKRKHARDGACWAGFPVAQPPKAPLSTQLFISFSFRYQLSLPSLFSNLLPNSWFPMSLEKILYLFSSITSPSSLPQTGSGYSSWKMQWRQRKDLLLLLSLLLLSLSLLFFFGSVYIRQVWLTVDC